MPSAGQHRHAGAGCGDRSAPMCCSCMCACVQQVPYARAPRLPCSLFPVQPLGGLHHSARAAAVGAIGRALAPLAARPARSSPAGQPEPAQKGRVGLSAAVMRALHLHLHPGPCVASTNLSAGNRRRHHHIVPAKAGRQPCRCKRQLMQSSPPRGTVPLRITLIAAASCSNR